MDGLKIQKIGQVLMSEIAMHREPLTALWRDESGQDLLEFALVAGLLSLCAIATTQTLAGRVANLWQYVATNLKTNLGS